MPKNVLSKLLTEKARDELLGLLDEVPVYAHQSPRRDRAYQRANKLLDNTLDITVDWYKGLRALVEDEKTTVGKLRYYVNHVPSYGFRKKGAYSRYLQARKVLGDGYLQEFSSWYRNLQDLVGISNHYRSIAAIPGMTKR